MPQTSLTTIFITIPWFLPAYRAGGPIQSIANLVKEFREGVQYYIFTSDTDLNGAALDNITVNEWVDFNEHTKVWYAGPEKISDNLVRQVEDVKPDVLFIVGVFSWHFNMVPVIFCKAPKKILSTRGMLHPGALSQKKWKKKLFLRGFKIMEYHHKVLFHASDEEERKYITNQFGKPVTIFLAGNYPTNIGFLAREKKEAGSLKLLSIAILSPMKNILLILQALQQVKATIQYDIYGPVKDENYRDECLLQIKTLPKNVSVFIHKGIEPHEVRNVLKEADVFILPSKSENFGHAMYEALSAGLPLITSHNTPWINLESSHAGMNVRLVDTGEITAAIEHFAKMPAEVFWQWRQGALAYAAVAVDKDLLRKGYLEMFLDKDKYELYSQMIQKDKHE